MNWIKYDKDVDGEMPEMNLNDPGTETVWVHTDNHYASQYGVGSYTYDEDGGYWDYDGCTKGYDVTHWAKIEGPVQKMDKCVDHQWEDTGGELCMWPPIRVYECVVCGAIGNVKGRQRGHGSHDITFNMSEITFSNKVCEPHYKSTIESI